MYKLLNGIDFYSAEEVDERFSNESVIAERERATAAEETLQSNIDTVTDNLTAEAARATTAEQTLQDNIDTENTRATAAEAALDTRMTDWETNLQTISDNLAAEVTRAQTAENTNATAITAETTRATAAEQVNSDAIAAEALRAQETERTINNTLLSESERAQRVESEIDTALSNEVTRATAAEQTLQDNIDTEEARATAAENTLTTDLAAEVTRATAAENTLTIDLAAEVTRATAAENTLTTDLAAEVTRAQAAETANATAISNEVTRATTAEQVLDQKIADEELRATTAEAGLTSSITSLSTRVTRNGVEIATNRAHQILTFDDMMDLPSVNFDDITRLRISNNQLVYVKDSQVWYKATTTSTEGDPVTWAVYNMPFATDKLEDYPYVVNPKPGQYRWLRFDPNNKNGLVLQKGVVINLHYFGYDETLHINADTAFDMGTLTAGVDYNIIMDYDGTDLTLTAKTVASTLSTDVVIGYFHTLCASVGNTYCRVRFPLGATVTAGVTKFLVQKYDKDTDPDFYAFYNKTVSTAYTSAGGTAITSGINYIYADVDHPLNGYVAGNILPESIWCDTWHPNSPRPTADRPDALVYCANFGTAIDVYFQSGTGPATKSAKTGACIRSRTPKLHAMDMQDVGKKLLTDHEFLEAAVGSNENTNIQGSAFASGAVSGGHSDAAGRRMISAIGCEDMCGVLWQWLDELGPVGNNTEGWTTNADSDGKFGQDYGLPYVLRAGGDHRAGVLCGSFSRSTADTRSLVDAPNGARGSSRVIRGRA